jgi:putative selenate reductase
MTDRFTPLPFPKLFSQILKDLETGFFFGIPHELFYVPDHNLFSTERFGQQLGTPLGPAAGPHTQLSHNITGAWLCGARYIELKTVQTLDKLDVPKPCIDLQDEGYNCEWSQELSIEQSYEQYLDAWIIIHLLSKYLGWNGEAQKTIFNMSVGYHMEGILKPNVQWFFKKMNDCSVELQLKKEALAKEFPWVQDVVIPSQISNNITLSTMHGCPPDEIEKIGMYLIREKGLHTIIKLNPTLLGSDMVREILNKKTGFRTPVPDEAFEHDLKYPDAVRIISNLLKAAEQENVFFGLKLTNTLESTNFRNVFSSEQQQMYMSGKALHPLAVNLAAKIRKDFPHIEISFSAGADCFNIHELLACNLSPVTVSSDLLKPGGYGRLSQYLENLKEILKEKQYTHIHQLLTEKPSITLEKYCTTVAENQAYRKALRNPDIKTNRPLENFDCIHAPCMTTCPADQHVPLYMYHTSKGNMQKAYHVITETNPFPTITGIACDHECQSKCTRINYDSTLAIREIKRYVSSYDNDESYIKPLPANGMNAAVIGAGPAGLSCAWYLKLFGFAVDVYEESASAGGMVRQTIPNFRMQEQEIENDILRITSTGINMHYNTLVNAELFSHLKKSGAFIFIGTGARNSRKLNLSGEDASGVKDPMKFLADFKQQKLKKLPSGNILVIGGGNTAMDVARSAKILSGKHSTVSIIYRRTIHDMPASIEEIYGTIEAGVEIHELLSPLGIMTKNGTVTALKCIRMETDGYDDSGRQKVKPVEGSFLTLNADMIIPAVGQFTNWDFVSEDLMKTGDNCFSTELDRVYIGGDARAGASNIISAIADGRRAAEAIAQKAGVPFPAIDYEKKSAVSVKELLAKKGRRIHSPITEHTAFGHFRPIVTQVAAKQEAQRCLLCDEICNVCVSVCPNFANQGYEVQPVTYKLQKISKHNDGSVSCEDDEIFSVTQKYQIYNIADLCNECGNCRTFCPGEGAPYQDKPKIHLSEESWKSAVEGYRFFSKNGSSGIEHKCPQNGISQLYYSSDSDQYIYQTPLAKIILNSKNLNPEKTEFLADNEVTIELKQAAIMHILLHHCRQKLSILTDI